MHKTLGGFKVIFYCSREGPRAVVVISYTMCRVLTPYEFLTFGFMVLYFCHVVSSR